ncbi:MAG: hypothetical protein A4E55_01871 [Pelotomaculum sp. PtaU1.Bin035]|nr:MAG: hypothetical protein A4E55_01871 [Pelotomaculum sp. PtaU1.Bin035]
MAEEIKLEQVEKILSQEHQTTRMRLSRIKPKSIQFKNPPVAVELGECQITISNLAFNALLTGKIYDLGVIAVIMRLPLPPGIEYEELKALSIEIYNADTIESLFDRHLDNTRKTLSSALVKEAFSGFVEDYIIFYFREWDKSWDPLPLLLTEAEPVSQEVRRETLRNSFSYGLDDLTIITWDTALVYDPTGSTDIPDLLEFANSQLLELRYYDSLLSGEMEKMYDAIEEAENLTSFRRLSHYRRIMSQLMELIVDITEITEKIDNSLKVTEDVFYARIYGTALSILRTKAWADSINRKINIINQSYTMLSDRNVNQRSELLELAIVFLILLEVFLGVFGVMK